MSPGGLQVLLDRPYPDHLARGLELEVRLFEPNGTEIVPGLSGRLQALEDAVSGTVASIVFLQGLPQGPAGERFLSLLDRRGATRLRPPSLAPFKAGCVPGPLIVQGDVLDFSMTGIGLRVPGPVPECARPGAEWRIDFQDPTGGPPLRIRAEVKRIDVIGDEARLGLSLLGPHGTSLEQCRLEVSQMLNRWRG
jgi:hypothetical protein